MKRIVALIAALIFPVGSVFAADVNATTCSSTDVAAAIASASAGDRVLIPSGTCSWASAVTLAKSLTIAGQTTTSRNASTYQVTPTDRTIIQKNGFVVTATTGVRITGITFDGKVTGAAAAALQVPKSPVGMRIDHNHFSYYADVWHKDSGGGYLNLLFDNNRITQPGEETLYIVGAGNASWTFGGSGPDAPEKTTWIEDNEIILVTAGIAGPIDSGEGARVVIRGNRFSGTSSYTFQEVIESHGHCYGQRDGWDNAGTYYIEVSDNQFHKVNPVSNGNVVAKIRAGKLYFHHNQIFDAGWAGDTMVRFWVQEVGTPCNTTPCPIAAHATMGLHSNPLATNWMCTSYPCPMQPNNSYIWANTWDKGTMGVGVQDANPATYMAENRDYWDDFGTNYSTGTASARPASCAVNKIYWASDTKTLSRCTSTNNWTSTYAAYTYPHPLQSGGTSVVGPPSGLVTSVR
jgi:hypothetical protein